MRVQYTRAENEIIEERRKENKNFDGISIPVEAQGKRITFGLEITDVHKFNMFITNWLNDLGKEDKPIINEIGAVITSVEFREPIKEDYLIFLKNYIDGILYGPKPEEQQPVNNDDIEVINRHYNGETDTIDTTVQYIHEDDSGISNISIEEMTPDQYITHDIEKSVSDEEFSSKNDETESTPE